MRFGKKENDQSQARSEQRPTYRRTTNTHPQRAYGQSYSEDHYNRSRLNEELPEQTEEYERPSLPERIFPPLTQLRNAHRARSKHRKQDTRIHKQNPIARLINEWFSRLLGVVSDRSFDQEERYATHRTKRDYLWNSIGTGVWGTVLPILTIVITWLAGADQAGVFALAFVTGKLLMFLANYGVRTYQVSDLNEKHSFTDYQINRVITCALMIAAGLAYSAFRGYSGDIATVFFGMYVYKMVDGLADVYEGRLQQKGKLYLAGISLTLRSAAVIVSTSLALLVTGSLGAACIVMAVVSVLTLILFTFPLAWLETPTGKGASLQSIISLFKQCFPLFVALFLYTLIDNMPKFVMEGTLTYDNQLYFNVLYFPAQFILLAVGLIYKPLLVKMADTWAQPEKRRGFDLAMVAMMAVIVGLTFVTILVMDWIGLKIMSVMYGLDFMQFRELSKIMLAAGGVTAAIDFLYQVVTILRRQKAVMKLYLITFVFSLFIPNLLIGFTGLTGAIMSYLVVMFILFVLLLVEYVSMRLGIVREEKEAEEELQAAAAAAMPRRRPSEIRAEREYREEVLNRRRHRK